MRDIHFGGGIVSRTHRFAIFTIDHHCSPPSGACGLANQPMGRLRNDPLVLYRLQLVAEIALQFKRMQAAGRRMGPEKLFRSPPRVKLIESVVRLYHTRQRGYSEVTVNVRTSGQ